MSKRPGRDGERTPLETRNLRVRARTAAPADAPPATAADAGAQLPEPVRAVDDETSETVRERDRS